MKFNPKEEVIVKSSGQVKKINETETISGIDLFYMTDGTSYSGDQIEKIVLNKNIINNYKNKELTISKITVSDFYNTVGEEKLTNFLNKTINPEQFGKNCSIWYQNQLKKNKKKSYFFSFFEKILSKF